MNDFAVTSSLKHGQMCEVSRKTFKKEVGHWTIFLMNVLRLLLQ